MPPEVQNYAHHRRFHPVFHFFVFPILAINLLLNFDSFIVCLGIDARIITRAVERHYRGLLGPAGASGYEYLDKIAACRREIFEGESYEVCLTTELRADGALDPLAAYRVLRARNPAPFAALLRLGEVRSELHLEKLRPEICRASPLRKASLT